VGALALPLPLGFQESNVLTSAGKAKDTFRPAAICHVFQAVIGIAEVDDCFLKGLWGFHESKYPNQA
jgi:hypothetical protein